MIMHCRPSEIDGESHKDMEAVKVILSARNEYNERNNERGIG